MRRDVADVALAEAVFAPHYALPLDHGCAVASVLLRAAPDATATAVSELIRGEGFAVVDASGDWAWGFCLHDGYVGYVPVAALGPVLAATHMVACPAALVFAAADIKSPVLARLPMGARIAGAAEGAFVRTADGFVHHRHVTAIGALATDPVEVAARLAGTPYRWGGRSGDGIDCSGLVQLALSFCGVAVARDTDQQRGSIGSEIPEGEALRRGDLVYWPGHVGFMADGETLLHANAHWMATIAEPLGDVLARQPEGGGIIARRRIAW